MRCARRGAQWCSALECAGGPVVVADPTGRAGKRGGTREFRDPLLIQFDALLVVDRARVQRSVRTERQAPLLASRLPAQPAERIEGVGKTRKEGGMDQTEPLVGVRAAWRTGGECSGL